MWTGVWGVPADAMTGIFDDTILVRSRIAVHLSQFTIVE